MPLHSTRAKCALVIIRGGGKKRFRDANIVTYHKNKGLEKGMQSLRPDLPPASGRQPLGVHLAHVAHSNQTDDEVFHPGRDGASG